MKVQYYAKSLALAKFVNIDSLTYTKSLFTACWKKFSVISMLVVAQKNKITHVKLQLLS